MYTIATLHTLNTTITTTNTLQYISLAASCRVYMRSKLLPRLLDELVQLQDSDASYEVYPHPQWQQRSALTALSQAYHSVHAISPPPMWFADESSLQSKITKHIWEHLVPSAQHRTTAFPTLLRRLQTAGFDLHDPAQLPVRLTWLMKAIRLVPSFVQFNYIRFVYNAWNTTRRYGKTVAKCQWCGLRFGDDIAHYSSCSVMLAALQQIRPFFVLVLGPPRACASCP